MPRKPVLIGLVLFVMSCESSAKAPLEPVPAASRPVVDEPVSKTPAPRDLTRNPPLIDVGAGEMYVGTLSTNQRLSAMHPSEYCLDDDKLYQGAQFRLGALNVFGVDEELRALAAHGPVAVSAEKKLGLLSRLRELGPCPENYEPEMVQMRSDWVPLEGGPNSTRALLNGLAYLDATKVQAVDMFAPLDGDKETVRFRIRNPFTLPLASLKFTAHYEGGPGKPMPSYLDKTLALEPGAWAELELPRHIAEETPLPSKRGSELRSVELTGSLGRATLEIELFVPRYDGR